MKTFIRNLFLVPALIAGVGLIPTGSVTAQTFMTLHSFTAISNSQPHGNSDGANPQAGLIIWGKTLYGTADQGGSWGRGSLFKLNTDGTDFTNLYSFTGGSDGANPNRLIVAGNTLFGTAYGNGNPVYGIVFAVNTDGTDFTNLHGFSDTSDGGGPSGLVLSSNKLYGTAKSGASSGNGTVFKVSTNGTGFTNLHSFTSTFPGTNSDGAEPTDLALLGNTLYGTAYQGGSSGSGTVFAVNTNGTGFTNLHSFAAISGPSPSTNRDGANPLAGSILSGNTIFGTTLNGGSFGGGTIFSVNADGTGFTNLHTFTAISITSSPAYANSDGANPYAGLILSGHTLYGTSGDGGSSGNGTVFALNTNGTGFTTLYSFTALDPLTGTNCDGANPQATLVLTNNTLYGTAANGGSSGNGTVFSLSFAPQLTIIPSRANVILMWPTNVAGFDYTGFTLQSAPAITGAFTSIPGTTNPYTNPIAGSQQFFRLISN